MKTPVFNPARSRALSLAVAMLGSAGVMIVAVGARRGEAEALSAPAAAPQDAAAAHAAAGVTTGPEVQAAFDDRIRELRQRADSAPSDRARVLELARTLHDGHRTAEAIPLYRRALELDPSDATVRYDLAAAYGDLGQWASARDALRERVDQVSTDAVALYDLGVVEANLGNTGAAIDWWKRAQALAVGDAELTARVSEALAQVGAQR